ncbi:hypothetical protein SAMN06265222_102254 [Neorhodopirellula lusitana]|uniref:Prenyltransferase n=1 Tax=Neorhodopirellula lusitana TaxID=445327 RepID=A0ABY1PWI7_9BACT|nr:hypothetical protein [Neorhodopirellula lusitana]SMP47170.1 hypothetical protein SAMN06265222_102254 [Neorhodopirellula lusitana]
MIVNHRSLPLVAWPSLLSLDAVAVAITWQSVLVVSFLHRWPAWPESLSLGATVWLIYVADRLLDASRLDVTRPHTLRHQFYHRHAKLLIGGWMIVALGAAGLVITHLSFVLIRWGLMLSALVLVYGASVHFVPSVVEGLTKSKGTEPTRRKWFPKEVQVGTLFACGVSLVIWPNLESRWAAFQLASTTVSMSVLFSINCFAVSRWEHELDLAQSFTRMDFRNHSTRTRLAMNLALLFVPVAALSIQLPMTLVAALAAGALGMSWMMNRHDQVIPLVDNGKAHFEIRGIVVDALLWIPTALCLMIP